MLFRLIFNCCFMLRKYFTNSQLHFYYWWIIINSISYRLFFYLHEHPPSYYKQKHITSTCPINPSVIICKTVISSYASQFSFPQAVLIPLKDYRKSINSFWGCTWPAQWYILLDASLALLQNTTLTKNIFYHCNKHNGARCCES